ncbi:MAG TPA: hypothetical protein PK971_04390, partial [Saprospiraceae bacterium]|nr:hypothetical protein [Saprospiraceae bacterium]
STGTVLTLDPLGCMVSGPLYIRPYQLVKTTADCPSVYAECLGSESCNAEGLCDITVYRKNFQDCYAIPLKVEDIHVPTPSAKRLSDALCFVIDYCE